MSLIDLHGVWRFDGQHDLDRDDQAAKSAGQVDETGNPITHGTFPWIRLFWLRTVNLDDPKRARLEIYDDEGNLGHFSWTGRSWGACHEAKVFKVPAGSYTLGGVGDNRWTVTLKHDLSIERRPSLVLSQYPPGERPSYADLDVYVASTPGPPVEQTITVDEGGAAFTWTSGDDKLTFSRVDPDRPDPSSKSTFGDVFHNTAISHLDYSWCGFDARRLVVVPDPENPASGFLSSPGTPSLSDEFDGALVFDYPGPDSYNYLRVQGSTDQKYVPFGVRLQEINVEDETADTSTIASGTEGAGAWAVTLGLSGGVEDLISLSAESTYRQEYEAQQSVERRYTLTRKCYVWLNLVTDLAQMALSDAVVGELQTCLEDGVLTKKGSNWEKFVNAFGMQYSHAVTHGRMTFMQTWFSLDAESYMQKQQIDVKAEASGMFDGIDAGVKGEFDTEWSSKTENKVSNEEVTSFTVGAEHYDVLFLDLRPLTELLSPLIVRYNPADDWGQFAPWVWYELRPALTKYVEQHVADPSLRTGLDVDYTPVIASVQLSVTGQSGVNSSLTIFGMSVTCTVAYDDPSEPLQDGPKPPDPPIEFLDHTDFNLFPGPGNDYWISPSFSATPFQPTSDQFMCRLLVRKGSRLSPRLHISVEIQPDGGGGRLPPYTKDVLLTADVEAAHNGAKGWSDQLVAAFQGDTLTVDVFVEDAGGF